MVRKPVPVKKAPAKKTMMSTIKGMGSREKKGSATTAAKSMASAATVVSTGRVLRKRN